MVNTRAPTYTVFTPAEFRKKGKQLAVKLRDEFLKMENVVGNGLQCSAATLFGGGLYTNIFNWTNPIAPTAIIVDHVIIRISSAATGPGCRMIMGMATITGAGQNSQSAANRAIANTYEGASRSNFVTGLPLTAVTTYDSRRSGATSFQRCSTFLQGQYQYLTARAWNNRPSALAGTVYVYWHKAPAGG
jgi:hypothetical protein